MTLAIQAVGEGLLGEARASVAAFTLGLLLTFLGVRINTRLIRAKVTWWFHDIESEGGLHVHHMVIGVVLMVITGLILIAVTPEGLWLQLCALVFGAGVALTLDEFALILRLQDVYWTSEGRLSVDAVIVAVCAGLLIILGLNPFETATTATGTAGVAGSRDRRGDHRGQPVLGRRLPARRASTGRASSASSCRSSAVVGAIRVARPNSPWAHRRYVREAPEGGQGATPRDHVNATLAGLARSVLRPHRRQAAPAERGGRRPAAGGAVGAGSPRSRCAGGCRGGGARAGRGEEGRRVVVSGAAGDDLQIVDEAALRRHDGHRAPPAGRTRRRGRPRGTPPASQSEAATRSRTCC